MKKITKVSKKALSILLTLLMIITAIPLVALPASAESGTIKCYYWNTFTSTSRSSTADKYSEAAYAYSDGEAKNTGVASLRFEIAQNGEKLFPTDATKITLKLGFKTVEDYSPDAEFAVLISNGNGWLPDNDQDADYHSTQDTNSKTFDTIVGNNYTGTNVYEKIKTYYSNAETFATFKLKDIASTSDYIYKEIDVTNFLKTTSQGKIRVIVMHTKADTASGWSDVIVSKDSTIEWSKSTFSSTGTAIDDLERDSINSTHATVVPVKGVSGFDQDADRLSAEDYAKAYQNLAYVGLAKYDKPVVVEHNLDMKDTDCGEYSWFYPSTVMIYDGVTQPSTGVMVEIDAYGSCEMRIYSAYISGDANGLALGDNTWKGKDVKLNFQWVYNEPESTACATTDGSVTSNCYTHTSGGADWYYANKLVFTGPMGDSEFSRTIKPTLAYKGNQATQGTGNVYTFSKESNEPIYVINYKPIKAALDEALTKYDTYVKELTQYPNRYTTSSINAFVSAINDLLEAKPEKYDFSSDTSSKVSSYAYYADSAVKNWNSAKNLVENTYTVRFVDGNGNNIGNDVTVGFNSAITGVPATASKDYTDTVHYTFTGWSPAIPSSGYTDADVTATGAVKTFTAQFSESAHSYTSSVETDSTCSAVGTTRYTCTCGKTYTVDDIAMKAHTYGTTAEYAKSNSDGTHQFKCTACDVYNAPVSCVDSDNDCVCDICGYKYEHVYDQETTNHLATAQTCTAAATYYKTCKCGAVGTETFEYGSPKGHNFGGKAVRPAASVEAHWYACQNEGCTAVGVMVDGVGKANETEACYGGTETCKDKAVCSQCGGAYGELSEKHVLGDYSEAVAPSCYKDGEISYAVCTVCGKKFNTDGEEITITSDPATGIHVYGTTDEYLVANGEGTHSYRCTTAGCTAISAPEACSYTAKYENVNGSYHVASCACCQSIDEDCADAEDDDDCNCDKCGALVAHTYPDTWTPDTENGGHYKACTVCSEKETGACSGGTANCQDKAICELCGQSYGATNPKNHGTYLVKVSAKAATCENDGNLAYEYCSKCDYTTYGADVVLEATGHNYYVIDYGWNQAVPKAQVTLGCLNAEYDDDSHNKTVNVDGTEVERIGTATCVTADQVKYKLVFTYNEQSFDSSDFKNYNTYTGSTNPDNHESEETYKLNDKDATCTAVGYTGDVYHSCCDALIEKGVEIPVKSHNYEGQEWTPDTENGGHYKDCVACDETGRITGTCTDENSNCKCDLCGADIEHVFNRMVKTDTYKVENSTATCLKGVEYYYSCLCGEKSTATFEDENSKLTHDYTSGVYQYNAETDKHTQKCKNGCEQFGGEADCSFTNRYVHVEGTETHDSFCVCGNSINEKCTNNGNCKCGTCGADIKHEYEWKVVTPANCGVAGVKEEVCKTCGAKGQTDVEIPATGEHNYNGKAWQYDAAVSEDAHYIDCAVCGETGRKLESHNESNWIISVNATCMEEGSKYTNCTVCQKVLATDTIAKKDHNYGDVAEYIGDGKHAYKCTNLLNDDTYCTVYGNEAVCTPDASNECKCVGCKQQLAHTPVVDAAIEANCVTTGKTEGSHCSLCKLIIVPQQDTTAPDNHDLKNVEKKDATCLEAGWEAYKYCTRCDYTTKVDIPAIAHRNKVYNAAVEATCIKEGNIEYWYCPDCAKNYEDEACATVADTVTTTAPDAHDYVEARNEAHLTRPTSVDGAWIDGYYTFECIRNASHTKKEYVARANYTDYDKAVKALTDLLATDITKEARAAINAALDENAVRNDLIYTEQAQLTVPTANLTEAFEDNAGDVNTCTVKFMANGNVYDEQEVVSGANAVVPAVNPTKAPDADKHYTFDSWDGTYTNITEDVIINAVFTGIDHSGGTATCKDKAVCSCGVAYGKTDNNNHIGVANVVKGYVAPTCKDEGYTGDTYWSCCEDVLAFKGQTIAKTEEHNYGTGTVVAPTCYAEGYTSYICSVCGKNYKDNYTETLSHSWTDWTVLEGNTCLENDRKTRSCKNDGCTVTENVVIEGEFGLHVFVVVNGTEATCTKDGSTSYKRCIRCGEQTLSEKIPATGHKDENGDGKCDECRTHLSGPDGCVCHKGTVISNIVRFVYTILSKLFGKRITCCADMEYWGNGIDGLT